METIAVLVVAVLVSLILYSIIRNEKAIRVQREELEVTNPPPKPVDVRTRVERRIVELIAEFPELDDDGITQILQDEVLNERIEEREFQKWATLATVQRIRRTMQVESVRAARRREGRS